MDMLIRMVGYCCDFKRKYRVVQIPATCAWTEVPSSVRTLYRQRVRWGRGLLQTFVRHRDFLLNKNYKKLGLITMPYQFIFELIAPIIEFVGFITFIYQAFTGVVNWPAALVIFLAIYTFCIVLSLVVMFYDYITGGSFRKVTSYFWVLGAALLEPFLYHPLIVLFSIKGYFNYLVNTKAIWGEMRRKGTDKKKKSSPEINSGKEVAA